MIKRFRALWTLYGGKLSHPIIQKAKAWILFFWILFVLAIYFNNSEFYYILASLSLVAFLLFILFGLFFGFKKDMTLNGMHAGLTSILKGREYSLSLPVLFSLFPLLIFFLVNVILFALLAYFDIKSLGTSAINIPEFASLEWLAGTLVLAIAFSIIKKRLLEQGVLKSLSVLIISLCLSALTAAGIYLAFPGLPMFGGIAINNVLYYEISAIQNISSVYLVFGILAYLSYALGLSIFKKLGFQGADRSEKTIFAIAIGLLPLIFGTFILVMAGLLYALAVWMLILSLLAISAKTIAAENNSLSSISFDLAAKSPKDLMRLLIALLVILVLALNFIAIFKPAPIDFDSLSAYYNAPNLFAHYHAYVTLPHKIGNMGQNTEMLYAAVLSILPAKYIIHFSLFFFGLCLFSFHHLLKRLFGADYALAGLLVYLFIPWNYIYINMNKVEFILSFYLLMVLYSAYLWYRENFKQNYLYLTGILSGVSIGIKYNAALLLVPLYILIFIFMLWRQKNWRKHLYAFILSGLLALLAFSPWMLKNKIYFNNSLYPYTLGKSLGVANDQGESNEFMASRYNEIQTLKTSRSDESGNLILDLFMTLWNKSTKRFYSDGHIDFGVIPLLVFPFGLFFIRSKWFLSGFLLASLYFCFWFLSGLHQSWYAFFGITLLSMLAPKILLFDKKITYLYSVFMVVVFFNFAMIIHPTSFLYLAGIIDKDAFLSENVEHYDMAGYINSLEFSEGIKIYMPADSRCAFIENNDRLILPDLYYTQFGSWLYNGGESQVLETLSQKNAKYILFSKHWDEKFVKWLSFYGLTVDEYLDNYKGDVPSVFDVEKGMRHFLDTNCRLISEDENYALYKLIAT